MSSKTPKAECEELMNELIPFAKQCLERYGEFFPFGGHMEVNGAIVHDCAQVEGTDRPKSQPLIEIMRNAFRENASNGLCKATAIVSDVRIKNADLTFKTDAIQISLEHRDNYSVKVVFPYIRTESGMITYQPLYAQRGDGFIFEKK